MEDRFKFRIWHLNDNSMNNLDTISFEDGQVGYVDYNAAIHKLSNVLKSMSINKFVITNNKIKITVIKE